MITIGLYSCIHVYKNGRYCVIEKRPIIIVTFKSSEFNLWVWPLGLSSLSSAYDWTLQQESSNRKI